MKATSLEFTTVGSSKSVKAIGNYDDGSSKDISDQVTWTFSDPASAHYSDGKITFDALKDQILTLTDGDVSTTITITHVV